MKTLIEYDPNPLYVALIKEKWRGTWDWFKQEIIDEYGIPFDNNEYEDTMKEVNGIVADIRSKFGISFDMCFYFICFYYEGNWFFEVVMKDDFSD